MATSIYYTESQKALMWGVGRKANLFNKSRNCLNRNHSSIQRIRAESGGIQAAQRCRSRLALTLAEREDMSRAVASGHPLRSIVVKFK